MNLPNFINFEPFNALRRKMHTDRLGRFGEEPAAPVADLEADATAATLRGRKKTSAPNANAPLPRVARARVKMPRQGTSVAGNKVDAGAGLISTPKAAKAKLATSKKPAVKPGGASKP